MLITFGLLNIFKITHENYLFTAVLIVLLSTIPDIDLRLEVAHRKYTHNILASIIFGGIFGLIFYYVSLGFLAGFIGGFSGAFLHILGDLMTYMPFKAFYPLSNQYYSMKFFRSNNKAINYMLLLSGFSMMVYYLSNVYSP